MAMSGFNADASMAGSYGSGINASTSAQTGNTIAQC
jgi:hypothetical protein